MSLIGSQCPRPVYGKPQSSSTCLLKPRANTSPISLNPRLPLVSPLLLSSMSTGTQGMQGLPLTIFSIPNLYLCRNIRTSKTQGPPFVCTPSKPKASPWSTYSSRTTMTTVKGRCSIRRTITRLVDKTFNQGQITLTPHKHQKRNSVSYPNFVRGPSVVGMRPSFDHFEVLGTYR